MMSRRRQRARQKLVWHPVMIFIGVVLFLSAVSCRGSSNSNSGSSSTAATEEYRRCRSVMHKQGLNATSTLQDFQQASCQKCLAPLQQWNGTASLSFQRNDDSNATNNKLDSDFHVVIYLTTQVTMERLIVMAAGLLAKEKRVTLIAGENVMPPENVVRDFLFRHLPCDNPEQTALQHSLLQVRYFPLNLSRLKCDRSQQQHPDPTASAGDVILCSIQNAPIMLKAFRAQLNKLESDKPDLLLMDATSVAGLIMMEIEKIPAIMLVDSKQILRQVLGSPPVLEWSELFSPSRLIRFLADRVGDRLASLDLMGAFLEWNRVRRSVGLAPVRTMRELWKVPLLLTTTQVPGFQQILPNLISTSDPLLPVCFVCSSQPVSPKYDEGLPAVVVTAAFRNDGMGRAHSRTLTLSLSIARKTVRAYANLPPCQDGIKDKVCWDGAVDFYVVRPAGTTLEHVPPDFVVTEDSPFLDTLSRHRVAAILSLCDESNLWTQSLGPPVVCMDFQNPRETTLAILRVMRQARPTSVLTGAESDLQDHDLSSNSRRLDPHHHQQQTHPDGLIWLLSIIDRLAPLRRHSEWESADEMGQDMMETVRDILQESSNQSATSTIPAETVHIGDVVQTFCVYVAATMLIVALLYLAVIKDLLLLTTKRPIGFQRHHHNSYYYHVHTVLEWFLQRVAPELEVVWIMWTTWWQEQWKTPLLTRITTLWQPHEDATATTGHQTSNSTQPSRKRRTAKKRH